MKLGYINRTGSMAFPPRYEWASIFKDGIATIYEERDHNAVYARHTGYINRNGKYLGTAGGTQDLVTTTEI